MTGELVIDGAAGEGGGQILRSSLSLSLVTGRPFSIHQIRAGRPKPGLLRQHLTAVQAAVAISGGHVEGAELGSGELRFAPARIEGGEHRFVIGTAGSTTLLLQTVLPALLTAARPSVLTIEGGTHNPFAPPFEFLARTFLPALRRMGATVHATLDAYGFYPAGGGRITVAIEPCAALTPIELLERGDVQVSGRVLLLQLPRDIGVRELTIMQERLGLDRNRSHVEQVRTAAGPGNAAQVVIEGSPVTEVVTAFGDKGVSAESVASSLCDEAQGLLAARVPVGQHLADQLLLPMALAGGGAFRTLTPTAHTVTNAEVLRRFLDVDVRIQEEGGGVARIDVVRRQAP
jgi:RNA 3'-terminal phosphate cyclase (ATP)